MLTSWLKLADLARSIKADLQVRHNDIFARQLWLSKIYRICKKPDKPVDPKPRPEPELEANVTPQQLCPRWPWDSDIASYTWQVQLDEDMPFGGKLDLSCENFRTFLKFCNTLQWKLGDRLACSPFELAALAFLKGLRFQLPVGTLATPQAYAATLRSGFAHCKKKQIVVAPLHLDKRNKNNGKTFPKGAFLGAEVYLEVPVLEAICWAFQKGAKATPSSWNMPFEALL